MNSQYFVVAFRAEHPLAQNNQNNRFHTLGSDLVRNALFQAKSKLTQMAMEGLRLSEQLQYVEVYVLTEYSSKPFRAFEEEFRKRMEEAKKQGIKGGAGIGGGFNLSGKPPEKLPIPEEYRGYDKVYFLNDVALQMYREGGVEFEVLKTITAEELPDNCHRCLRGPYLPKEQA